MKAQGMCGHGLGSCPDGCVSSSSEQNPEREGDVYTHLAYSIARKMAGRILAHSADLSLCQCDCKSQPVLWRRKSWGKGKVRTCT